jgi:hypothetical protein
MTEVITACNSVMVIRIMLVGIFTIGEIKFIITCIVTALVFY